MITRVDVCFAVKAPFATRGNETAGFGIDHPLARTSDGRLMIPGTHVIGKMAHAARELHRLLSSSGEDAQDLAALLKWDLEELFAEGSQSRTPQAESDSDGRERRRGLTASDFVHDGEEGSGSRVRVAIDNATGAVANGMIQMIEQPFKPGEELLFQGGLYLLGQATEERLGRLRRMCEFIPQLGGLRSVGYGEARVESFRPVDGSGEPAPFGKRSQLRLSFTSPFCVGEARNAANLYSSAGYVPGGVLKGAMARQALASDGRVGFLDSFSGEEGLPEAISVLARDFSKVRIRHAFPVPKGEKGRRSPVLPESLFIVRADDGPQVVDLAGLDDPALPVLLNGQVPIGMFDWKDSDFGRARSLFGLPEAPARELRVRTQIDEKKKAAMPSRLFAVEYTVVDKHDFIGELDLSGCDDAEGVGVALSRLLANGLAGMGRGGAFAKIEWDSAGAGKLPPQEDDRVVLVLQSAALLRAPEVSPDDLRFAYEEAFREIGLPSGWGLSGVFARERLAGGGFFRNRMAEGRRQNYSPWLLTEAGATFIFDRFTPDAEFPTRWFDKGLEVPTSVLGSLGENDPGTLYRSCPYLPENGYGEVSLGVSLPGGEASWKALSPSALDLSIEGVEALMMEAEG